ncbi:MAG: ATP phosphoribosyltransferase [Bdellovibrionota bacterium]
MTPSSSPQIKLALPKGRMEKGVFDLMQAAGIQIRAGSRTYRPIVSLPEFEAKILKPRDIVEMLHLGSRDVGFAGADWVAELGVEIVELLDTGLDPVKLVAAAPTAFLENGKLPERAFVVASEYERLTRAWIERRGYQATFVRANGATEVFPPEDADCIVDNTASGATLRANQLEIVDELLYSSTRLYANVWALEDKNKRTKIEHLVLLLRSVIEARKRVMLEVNVTTENFDALIAILPCMREPTIAPLHGNSGFALKAAVPRSDLPRLIPAIKNCGGTDIVVSELSQIVP